MHFMARRPSFNNAPGPELEVIFLWGWGITAAFVTTVGVLAAPSTKRPRGGRLTSKTSVSPRGGYRNETAVWPGRMRRYE